MTVTLDLAQDTEQALLSRAAARGTSVANYIEAIIAREVVQSDGGSPCAVRPKNLVELGAPLRGLFTDEELDFKRESSYARDLDFS